MRSDCKHYQTRTYPSGDTMRKCGLDLAPKAPWECPADCSSYERRLADVAWNHGSLITPATPEAPASIEEDDTVAELLDSAEDIINAAAPTVRAEVDAEAEAERRERRRRTGRWWPFNR
jgi:hypothetical protein